MRKVTEEVLWQMYQTIWIYLRAFRCVPHSQEYYLSASKELVFLMDFADVFPIMYPDRGKRSQSGGIRLVEEFCGGISWKNLIKQAQSEGISLALAPAARLEAFEMLRRPMVHIDHTVKGVLPDDILDRGMDEILSCIDSVSSKDISNFIKKLSPLVTDSRVEESIKAPARRFLDLYQSGMLKNIEEVLPEGLLNRAIKLGRQDKEKTYEKLKISFDNMPRRRLAFASHEELRRDNFHDAVDIHNLRLAHDLVMCGKSEGIYAPLVSAAQRTVTAGVQLSRTTSFVQPSLSLVLMLIILAQYGRGHLNYHVKEMLSTLESLYIELKSIALLHDIAKMTRVQREEYFKSARKEVTLSSHIDSLFDRFQAEIITPYFGQDDSDAGAEREKCKEEKITDLKELVARLRGEKQSRKDIVVNMKALIGDFEDDLSDEYLPDCPFAENLTGWVNSHVP